MRRSLLALPLLVVLVPALLSGASAADTPAADTKVYLPFVTNDAPLPNGLHITRYDVLGWYAEAHDYVYGHIENRTNAPLYSVALEMDVHNSNCFQTDPCEETDFTERVTPAFAATIPNQFNPFRTRTYWQYKTSYSFGALRVIDARRNPSDGRDYEALTIVRVETNYTIEGMARNDSDRVLHDARVVVYVPDECPWQEATLDSTTLAPGQETSFSLESYCRPFNIAAVGQGVVAD
jgi:hypothetical protein